MEVGRHGSMAAPGPLKGAGTCTGTGTRMLAEDDANALVPVLLHHSGKPRGKVPSPRMMRMILVQSFAKLPALS
jgi:hypothetical protein